MAIIFPDPTLQTPVDTFSPTSTPDQTTNGLTYIYNNTIGAWVSTSPGGGPTAATLAEAATGTLDTVYSSPKTAVPKNAAGMTGAAILPGGDDAERALITSPAAGMLRYNDQGGIPVDLEYYDGANWTGLLTGSGTLFAWGVIKSTGVSTFTIDRSYNVASISILSPGDFNNQRYSITFSNAAPTADYVILGNARTQVLVTVGTASAGPPYAAPSTTAFELQTAVVSGGSYTAQNSSFFFAVIL